MRRQRRTSERNGLGSANAERHAHGQAERALAGGVQVVTCRYLGGGQIERIQTARSVRAMERMFSGPVSAFLDAIRDKEQRDETQIRCRSRSSTRDGTKRP